MAATFIEVWRMARHHDHAPGSAAEWIAAIAARRAVESNWSDADPRLRDIVTVHDQSRLLELLHHIDGNGEASTPAGLQR